MSELDVRLGLAVAPRPTPQGSAAGHADARDGSLDPRVGGRSNGGDSWRLHGGLLAQGESALPMTRTGHFTRHVAGAATWLAVATGVVLVSAGVAFVVSSLVLLVG